MIFRSILMFGLLVGAAHAAHAAPLDDALQHYEQGRFQEAAALLAPLAKSGDPVAQHRLAVLHFYGRGVPENEKTAMDWARKSADQGNADGMFFIGTMYLFGDTVPKSVNDPDVEAAKWLFQAASRGHAEAEYSLGLLFLAGKGVVQDQNEAMKWIGLAAEHGHPGARSFLAGGGKSNGH